MDENEKALTKAHKAQTDVIGYTNKCLEGVNAKMEARVTEIAEKNGVSLSKALDLAINDTQYQDLYREYETVREGSTQALEVLG